MLLEYRTDEFLIFACFQSKGGDSSWLFAQVQYYMDKTYYILFFNKVNKSVCLQV